MAKVNLQDITSGYSSTTKINENNATLEAALDNTLSRNGASPNAMEAELDMNSNSIVNLGAPQNPTDAARWADVTGSLAVSTPLPAQTGNSGKYITTNGSDLSWSTPPAYNPITSLETAASITPTNYSYLPGDVRRYNAAGDGSTDDTAAIQNALNTKHDVYVPGTAAHYKITAPLVPKVSGQRIFGDGILSQIKQYGTNANASVFSYASTPHVRFERLFLKPNTTTASFSHGYGVYASLSDRTIIKDCYVGDHRRGAFSLNSCNYCHVINNQIFDSIVTGSEAQSDTGIDIYLSGGSSYNIVKGNICINGSGVGIGLQTTNPADIMRGNKIVGNTIKDQDAYGIMLYQTNVNDIIDQTLIESNLIENITGSLNTGATLFYGAGIYIQTAEHFVVSNNHIINTNSNRSLPFSGSAVPAAIAVSAGAGAGSNSIISNNLIEDCYWGITDIQSGAITAAGRSVTITGNKVRNSDSHGIYLIDVPNAIIADNVVQATTVANNGVYIRHVTTAQIDDILIHNNLIKGFEIGVETSGTINRAIISNNTIRDNNGYAIQLAATYSHCSHNTIIQGAGGDGIRIQATAVDGFVVNNIVQGGAQGLENSGTLRINENLIMGATVAYNGGIWKTLTDSATPSVKNSKWVSNAFTTSITNFTDGREGQTIVLKALASFTVTNGATIALSGATNFAMTSGRLLTLVLDGTVWREIARQ